MIYKYKSDMEFVDSEDLELSEGNKVVIINNNSDLISRSFISLIERVAGRRVEVDFYIIDLQDAFEFSDIFEVEVCPTTFFFKDGKIIYEASGLVPEELMEKRLQASYYV